LTDAALVPTFDGDGVPVSVLIDFDGTVALDDTGDLLLERLVGDAALVRRMDELYLRGEKGSRELIAWDMEVLPREADALWAILDTMRLDETLVELLAAVRALGAAAEIVSDGVGFHIERLLASIGVTDLPVATNRTLVGEGGAGVSFPFGHPACFVCGTCKRERIRLHRGADRAVVFVGDGPSDRYAAHHADVIFAKASLAAWCEVENLSYEPWERLADVAEWLELAVLDGRLPASSETYADWATAARPEVERYICGPEVWGVGRTVAGRAPGSAG
jgi:2-hydroxy-3-keto-5-methylthiopentenyl-1-phosphate phosphatase